MRIYFPPHLHIKYLPVVYIMSEYCAKFLEFMLSHQLENLNILVWGQKEESGKRKEKTEGVFTTEKGLCLNFAISQKLESRGLFIKRSVVCVLREGKAPREFGKTVSWLPWRVCNKGIIQSV